jgi:hypothetical protein
MFFAIYCPDALPYISCDQIMYQSKSSGLKKALICFQVAWFCIQCITRLAFRISINLLELNAFGHSICALLLAFLWWHKPQDVQEPTLIPVCGPELERLCASMCMASEFEDQIEFDLFRMGVMEQFHIKALLRSNL